MDFKAAFIRAVDTLIAADITDREQRMEKVGILTESYTAETGEKPDEYQLERLTDYILREELTDTHPDKVTNTEYPFFSTWQLDLRRDRETSLKAAEERGTDGRSHAAPKRRRRTNYENYFVDKNAHIRNKERAIQYEKDTAAGTIKSYNLHDTGGELSPEFVSCAGVGEIWADRLSLVY